MTKRGQIERELLGRRLYPVGVDEVGRGCLAGPVYAGACQLDYHMLGGLPESQLALIRDSKTLSASQRQSLLPLLKKISKYWHVASASPREIEELGIVPATELAMERALKKLEASYVLLVDGRQTLSFFKGEQRAVIKGDQLCYCIAAAAILAKESRDAYMREQAHKYPDYGFASHVGYGTRFHLEALAQHGPCGLHRHNFAPVQRAASGS